MERSPSTTSSGLLLLCFALDRRQRVLADVPLQELALSRLQLPDSQPERAEADGDLGEVPDGQDFGRDDQPMAAVEPRA